MQGISTNHVSLFILVPGTSLASFSKKLADGRRPWRALHSLSCTHHASQLLRQLLSSCLLVIAVRDRSSRLLFTQRPPETASATSSPASEAAEKGTVRFSCTLSLVIEILSIRKEFCRESLHNKGRDDSHENRASERPSPFVRPTASASVSCEAMAEEGSSLT